MKSQKCTINEIFIEQFIDNELPYEESSEMASHLKDCSQCDKKYKQIKTLKSLISNISQTEKLTISERNSFNDLIDSTPEKSILNKLLDFSSALFSNHKILVPSSAALLSALFFFIFITIQNVDQKSSNLISEIINIHSDNLPDEFSKKENMEEIIEKGIKAKPEIASIKKAYPLIKGRFSRVAASPAASLFLKDKKGNAGTLLFTKSNKSIAKLFKNPKCNAKPECKISEHKVSDHNILHWKKNNNNYIFVSDSNQMRSNLAKLVNLEY